MRSFATHTAVLLFALPDSTEAGRKTVAACQSETVWRAMRRLTKDKVRSSGLTFLDSGQLTDHQGSFGEQLTGALAAGFALGYDRIICIGNDCPDLSVRDLRLAADALANGQVPVGADRRGGLYLIGFCRNQFNAQTLSQLPWQTEKLADALRGYVASRGFVPAYLPVRIDINQRLDAVAAPILQRGGSRLLTIIRQALVWLVKPAIILQLPPCPSHCCELLSGRAPPQIA